MISRSGTAYTKATVCYAVQGASIFWHSGRNFIGAFQVEVNKQYFLLMSFNSVQGGSNVQVQTCYRAMNHCPPMLFIMTQKMASFSKSMDGI